MAKDTPKPTIPRRDPKSAPVQLRPDQLFYDIGPPEEIYIGRVVAAWNRLENCLNELLWRFTGLSFEDGRLFTERMDPSRSIALLRALVPRKLDGEQLQKLVNVLAVADQLRDDRNFIVHGTWSILQPEGQPTASSIRAKSAPGEVIAEHFPHARMKAIITEIDRTRVELVKILRAVPWPYDEKSS